MGVSAGPPWGAGGSDDGVMPQPARTKADKTIGGKNRLESLDRLVAAARKGVRMVRIVQVLFDYACLEGSLRQNAVLGK